MQAFDRIMVTIKKSKGKSGRWDLSRDMPWRVSSFSAMDGRGHERTMGRRSDGATGNGWKTGEISDE